MEASQNDEYFKFSTELEKREEVGGAEALLAQEIALVSEHVTVADLAILADEGTFPDDKRSVGEDETSLGFLDPDNLFDGVNERAGEVVPEDYRDTDWENLNNRILEFVDENDVLNRLGIENIEDMDPAKAVLLAYEFAKNSMTYDKSYDNQDKREQKIVDKQSVNQILDSNKGVCKQYAKVVTAVYQSLKSMDKSGSMRDTHLIYVGDSSTPVEYDTNKHAFCALIAKRGESGEEDKPEFVVSISDPTYYANEEVSSHLYTDVRLSVALSLMARHRDLGIPVKDMMSLVTQQLNRVNERVNFSAMEESGFLDERVAGVVGGRYLDIVLGYCTLQSLFEKSQESSGGVALGALDVETRKDGFMKTIALTEHQTENTGFYLNSIARLTQMALTQDHNPRDIADMFERMIEKDEGYDSKELEVIKNQMSRYLSERVKLSNEQAESKVSVFSLDDLDDDISSINIDRELHNRLETQLVAVEDRIN